MEVEKRRKPRHLHAQEGEGCSSQTTPFALTIYISSTSKEYHDRPSKHQEQAKGENMSDEISDQAKAMYEIAKVLRSFVRDPHEPCGFEGLTMAIAGAGNAIPGEHGQNMVDALNGIAASLTAISVSIDGLGDKITATIQKG